MKLYALAACCLALALVGCGAPEPEGKVGATPPAAGAPAAPAAGAPAAPAAGGAITNPSGNQPAQTPNEPLKAPPATTGQ